MPQKYPLLARQPIFNRDMQVVAYELLYRAGKGNKATIADGDTASTQVLLNTFAELSVKNVVGNHKAFINFTRELMEAELPFDTSQLVIEVLESETVNSHLLHILKDLRQNGFTIALDDFELTPASEPLLAYADIVKLDVLALPEEKLKQHITHLKNLGLQIVAEKIESFDMLAHCKTLGCDMFQGYFLERPAVIEGRRLSENKQAVLRLLTKLNEPDVTFEEIEKIIACDPVLSFKLLRLVNSAAFGLPRTIESMRQALTLLGLNVIKNWAGLIAMTKLEQKPTELSTLALSRAKLCELMASGIHPKHDCARFFTVGLLSMMDAFLDTPLEQIVTDIQLSDDLKSALLHHTGEEGKFLHTVVLYERGDWGAIDWEYLEKKAINPGELTELYLQTLNWVDNTQLAIQSEIN